MLNFHIGLLPQRGIETDISSYYKPQQRLEPGFDPSNFNLVVFSSPWFRSSDISIDETRTQDPEKRTQDEFLESRRSQVSLIPVVKLFLRHSSASLSVTCDAIVILLALGTTSQLLLSVDFEPRHIVSS